jgi:hypothetical protein
MARNRGDFEGQPPNNGGDVTGWLRRRDSNLCMSKSDLLNSLIGVVSQPWDLKRRLVT